MGGAQANPTRIPPFTVVLQNRIRVKQQERSEWVPYSCGHTN